MYYASKYNHAVQLEMSSGRKVRAVSNLFFGSSSVVDEELYNTFKTAELDGEIPEERLAGETGEYFLERGYIWKTPDAEENLIRCASGTYGNRHEIAAGLRGGHYGFITSLYCNLACPYCFQRGKADSVGYLTPRQVDLGLAVVTESEERAAALLKPSEATLPKISITGGEPLLRSGPNLDVLYYLLDRLENLHWPCGITTNGTELVGFISDRKPTANNRNMQVTLDGPPAIHNSRRIYRNGSPSFDHICAGVDAALCAGWHITLRVNLDMSNVSQLPALAEFVRSRGWMNFPAFSAYVSPVTDHGSLGGSGQLKDEADLLLMLLKVVERAPTVREVFDIRHFRGFNYVERLLLHKDPRYPVIYRCEAVMGMFIFDPRGDVHVCLEAAGDPSLRVGRYDPDWELDEIAFSRWMQRNVIGIPDCRTCKVRFLCAGGCTFESFARRTTTCCMPFLREMDIAWQYYARTKPELFM